MYSTVYKGFCKKVPGLKQTDIEYYTLDEQISSTFIPLN